MEGDRELKGSRLTTWVVGLNLAAALLCLAGGLVAARLQEAPLEAEALGPSELPAGLAAGRGAAWLSLGVVLLFLTPLARLLGMLRTFARVGDRQAAGATVAVVLLMLLSLALSGLG